MIRLAKPSDLNRAIELLRDAAMYQGFDIGGGFTFPFDPAYGGRMFRFHTTTNNAVCFVYDVAGTAQGVLMGVAFEHPYGPVRISKDSLWWIDREHRGGTAAVRMLDAFEKWAKERGCVFGGIAGMGDSPNITRLLERRGYKAAEVHFLKAI